MRRGVAAEAGRTKSWLTWNGVDRGAGRARYRAPDGFERSKTFTRKADAERWLAFMQMARGRGEWVDPALGRTTLDAWIERWWPTTANLRPSTRARDETYVRCYLLPHFGTWRLADIGQLEVSTWVVALSASGRAPATVRKAYQLLGKAMGAAVDAGLIARSPCRRVALHTGAPKTAAGRRAATLPRSISDALANHMATIVATGDLVFPVALCALRTPW